MDRHCQHNERRIEELVKDMASAKTEHHSFKRRLDELEENGRKQNEILITLQRQADAIESINKKIDVVADSVEAVNGRVAQMEKEPAERWKKISFEIIKYIVLAAAGAVAGYFLK